MKLLEQIKRCSKQFTYDYYVTQCQLMHLSGKELLFSKFSADGKIVSEKIVANDMQSLKKIGVDVSDVVDRAIAHMDKRGADKNVIYSDIENSIDLFNRITCKYLDLLTAHNYLTLKPMLQINESRIFTVPLDLRKRGATKRETESRCSKVTAAISAVTVSLKRLIR